MDLFIIACSKGLVGNEVKSLQAFPDLSVEIPLTQVSISQLEEPGIS